MLLYKNYPALWKSIKIAFLLLCSAILVYLFCLPYVPRLNKNNPATIALVELRKKQALKKKKALTPQLYWKKLNEISPYLVQAVILAEDDVFYQHKGFDFEQIKIAVKINWKKKKFAYGGSTLTQQLARTLYLSPSKNILRKIKEAIITFWIERALSKKRILELYLNAVEWGDGIFGAEAAARNYYQKSCSDLTPEESVALASILPSPKKWSPHRETPFMLYRRSNILSRMRLTEEESAHQETKEKEAEKSEISEQLSQDQEE